MRQDHEPPSAIARRGWRYHHVGIPTAVPRVGERYLPEYRLYVAGFEESAYGIEWMRFEHMRQTNYEIDRPGELDYRRAAHASGVNLPVVERRCRPDQA